MVTILIGKQARKRSRNIKPLSNKCIYFYGELVIFSNVLLLFLAIVIVVFPLPPTPNNQESSLDFKNQLCILLETAKGKKSYFFLSDNDEKYTTHVVTF